MSDDIHTGRGRAPLQLDLKRQATNKRTVRFAGCKYFPPFGSDRCNKRWFQIPTIPSPRWLLTQKAHSTHQSSLKSRSKKRLRIRSRSKRSGEEGHVGRRSPGVEAFLALPHAQLVQLQRVAPGSRVERPRCVRFRAGQKERERERNGGEGGPACVDVDRGSCSQFPLSNRAWGNYVHRSPNPTQAKC